MDNLIPDVHNINCPSRIVLDIISNKWVILIVDKLSKNAFRFGELKREIQGISPKVLTHLLKMLEQNGIVLREDFNEMPLRVEYSLSPLGRSLSAICKLITVWAENHIQDIIQANTVCK